jgi:hypothetical protein
MNRQPRNRYRLDAIPGLELELPPTEWSPPAAARPAAPIQGQLPFSDGSHLGPLFNLPG